jgi:hypothetical protein
VIGWGGLNLAEETAVYDTNTSRWLQPDPEGFDALDPNLYRGMGNDPTNATDSSGLEWTKEGVINVLKQSETGQIVLKGLNQGDVTVKQVDHIWRWYKTKGPDGKEVRDYNSSTGTQDDDPPAIYILRKETDVVAAMSLVHEFTHCLQGMERKWPLWTQRNYGWILEQRPDFVWSGMSDIVSLPKWKGRGEVPIGINTQVEQYLAEHKEKDPELTAHEWKVLRWEYPAYRNEALFLLENPQLITKEAIPGYYEQYTKERTPDFARAKQTAQKDLLGLLKGASICEQIAVDYILASRLRDRNAKTDPNWVRTDKDGNPAKEGEDPIDFGKVTTMWTGK